MLRKLQSVLQNYKLIPITKDNYNDAAIIYATNQDFFLLTEGKKAAATDILESVAAVPNGFDHNSKYCVGIWNNDSIIAILDFLVGYPTRDCIWIGLLLVHGELQGQSVGSDIIKALIKASKSASFKEVRLAVIDENKRGSNFWKKVGFSQIETKTITHRSKCAEIIVFMYEL